MIYGIGVDIVERPRIKAALAQYGMRFVERILAPARHQGIDAAAPQTVALLAKHFAAKEALAKALGCGMRGIVQWPAIDIIHNELGAPAFTYNEALGGFMTKNHLHAKLSIADEKTTAIAFVIIEQHRPD